MYKIPARTLFLGKRLVFMPECHSTNTLALELCQQKEGGTEGTLVITSNQTAGRGQRGNTWIAEPGKNLTFSFILNPSFLAIRDQFHLNIFVSLAIRDYLKSLGLADVSIKWPNDIYVGSKKICGILIENQIQGALFTHSVVGIGLNMNQTSFELPTATSLALETGQSHDLNEALENLLLFLEARYIQLRQNRSEILLRDYDHALYWRNQKRIFSSADGEFEGIINGINGSGQLLVLSNHERAFDLKEISYIR